MNHLLLARLTTFYQKRLFFSKNPWSYLKKSDKQIQKLYASLGLTTFIFASYYFLKSSDPDPSLSNEREKRNSLEELAKSHNSSITAEQCQSEESIREKFNFIDKVVRKCASSVFYLEIRDPNKLDAETGQAVIFSNGSGFVITHDGYALTNAHVVMNKPQCTITALFRNGKSYTVQIQDADMNMDLALLKIDAPSPLPVLQFGRPGDVSVGEWVIALGSPLSLSNSVTVGIISSVNRPAEELGLKNHSMTYIQTDASITFGNSGGPLVNLDGDVIGINNLRLTSGISFAIPIEYAKKFINTSKQLRKNKTDAETLDEAHQGVGRTLFGMTTISLSLEIINDMLRENKAVPKDVIDGLLVWKICKGTPAQTCGIEVGDIITHINGVPVREACDLYYISRNEKLLNVSLFHKGKKKIVVLTCDSL